MSPTLSPPHPPSSSEATWEDPELRVLIVSDDQVWRAACYEQLPETFDVVWVPLLETAIEELAHQTYDAVVCDLNLADAMPVEIGTRLKELSETLTVIGVTGDSLVYAWLEESPLASRLYLRRPGCFAELASVVAARLARSKSALSA